MPILLACSHWLKVQSPDAQEKIVGLERRNFTAASDYKPPFKSVPRNLRKSGEDHDNSRLLRPSYSSASWNTQRISSMGQQERPFPTSKNTKSIIPFQRLRPAFPTVPSIARPWSLQPWNVIAYASLGTVDALSLA